MKKITLFITLFSISLFGTGQAINQIGYYNTNGIFGLSSTNNYMILSSGEIIDNSDPSLPTLVSQYSFNGFASATLAFGNYAYFGTGATDSESYELFIADISNINSPTDKSSIGFTIGNGVYGMDITENTLFVALGGDGIVCSIDVTDNSNPTILDTLFIPDGQCRDIVTADNYAFAAHAGGLKVIDISNTLDIQLITSIGSGYNSIDMSESLVFMGKSEGGIDVFDISDPINPSLAFSIPNSGGCAWDLKYFENHVYLATNSNGLFIYKIAASNGIEMANFPNTGNGQSFGVCLQDSLVLLSGLMNGVAILHYDSTGIIGINPMSTVNQLNVFPNPTREFVSIDHSDLVFNCVKVFNLEGKLIKEIDQTSSIEKIDIRDLSIGEYIFSFETNNGIITKKVIKVE